MLYTLVVVLLVALAVFVVIGAFAEARKTREAFTVTEQTTTDIVVDTLDDNKPPRVLVDIDDTTKTSPYTNRHHHANLSNPRHRHYAHTPHNHDATDIATVFPPTMHVRESDAIEDEWDAIARADKLHYNEQRGLVASGCDDGKKQYTNEDIDAASARGYTLNQPMRGTCPVRAPASSADLTAYGHCTSSPTVWSTLQPRVPPCVRQRHHAREPVHLSEVHASITDDSSVGTIMPKFSYKECYD